MNRLNMNNGAFDNEGEDSTQGFNTNDIIRIVSKRIKVYDTKVKDMVAHIVNVPELRDAAVNSREKFTAEVMKRIAPRLCSEIKDMFPEDAPDELVQLLFDRKMDELFFYLQAVTAKIASSPSWN